MEVLGCGAEGTAGLGGRRDHWRTQLVFSWMRCHLVSRVWRISTELMMVNHHLDFKFIGLSDFFTISWDEARILADTKVEIVLRAGIPYVNCSPIPQLITPPIDPTPNLFSNSNIHAL